MFAWKDKGKLHYLEIEEFKKFGINACFTSRLGGVSKDPFSTLNLGLHTGDKLERVLANRRLLAEALELDYSKFVAGEQIHSNQVYIVGSNDCGKGAVDHHDSISGVDALITAKVNIPLISFYADCVPLYIMEPHKGIIALAHAGWKGTVLKIALKTIEEMKRVYHINPEDLWVGIGPSISKDYYEVDNRVIEHFRGNFADYSNFVTKRDNERFLLDLKAANTYLFEEAGVKPDQIIDSEFCTYRDNEYFYSYRKEQGTTGRMASIIYRAR